MKWIYPRECVLPRNDDGDFELAKLDESLRLKRFCDVYHLLQNYLFLSISDFPNGGKINRGIAIQAPCRYGDALVQSAVILRGLQLVGPCMNVMCMLLIAVSALKRYKQGQPLTEKRAKKVLSLTRRRSHVITLRISDDINKHRVKYWINWKIKTSSVASKLERNTA